jgi:hypothetical protein
MNLSPAAQSIGTATLPSGVKNAHKCQGEGCSQVWADRNGDALEIHGWGNSYLEGHLVWVQIDIYNEENGSLIWHDRVEDVVDHKGETIELLVFVDCGFLTRAKVTTWVSGRGRKPLPVAQITI